MAWRAAFIYLSPLLFESVHWKGPFRGKNQRIKVCWPCEMVLYWAGRPPQSTEQNCTFTASCHHVTLIILIMFEWNKLFQWLCEKGKQGWFCLQMPFIAVTHSDNHLLFLIFSLLPHSEEFTYLIYHRCLRPVITEYVYPTTHMIKMMQFTDGHFYMTASLPLFWVFTILLFTWLTVLYQVLFKLNFLAIFFSWSLGLGQATYSLVYQRLYTGNSSLLWLEIIKIRAQLSSCGL